MATQQKTSAKTGSGGTGGGSAATGKPVAKAAEPKKPAEAARPAPAAAPATQTAEPASAKPSLSVVSETKPKVAGDEVKKKDLIDLVVERSGLKKKDAKPAVDAMIDVLAELIGEGRDLNLPPLGKIKYQRLRETPNARIIVLKLRQGKSDASRQDKAKESVAEDDD